MALVGQTGDNTSSASSSAALSLRRLRRARGMTEHAGFQLEAADVLAELVLGVVAREAEAQDGEEPEDTRRP